MIVKNFLSIKYRDECPIYNISRRGNVGHYLKSYLAVERNGAYGREGKLQI